MEWQLYAIANYVPDHESDKVTTGKPYLIDRDNGVSIIFRDDTGESRHPNKRNSALLDGGDWTIVKESDLTPEQRRMAGLPTEDATIAELRDQLSWMEKRLERQQDRDTKVFDELSERIEALEARVPVEEKAEPEWPQERRFGVDH